MKEEGVGESHRVPAIEIIEVDGKKYDVEKCMGPEAYSKYLTASPKVRSVALSILEVQIRDMNQTWARLEEQRAKWEEDRTRTDSP